MKYKAKLLIVLCLVLAPFTILIPKAHAYIVENASESYRVNYGLTFNAWVEVTLNVEAHFYQSGQIVFLYSTSVTRSGLPWFAGWVGSAQSEVLDGRPKSEKYINNYIELDRYTTGRGYSKLVWWFAFLPITAWLYPHVVFDEQTYTFYGIAYHRDTGGATCVAFLKFLSHVDWSKF